ncbi:MAG TPA: hypothetical protein DCW90_19780 [Lachnospiraceae bacterium]|nr:hypothetical protein [Lachnospiraceae bacterium]
MSNKTKHRKPPEMPYWYWLDTDNCWRCKNRNGCSNCGTVKKYRKKFFQKKSKEYRRGRYDE